MKKFLINLTICIAVLSFAAACTPFDKNYGESEKTASEKTNSYQNIKIPEIKSDDEIMPTYIDISLYDEENYSNIYLGKKFKYNFTYAGSEFNLPTNYREMVKKGWQISDGEYTVDSTVLAGKTARANFVNEYNKQIVAVFYNSSNSSAELKKCSIVKLIIPENCIYKEDSVYGQFWINGVSNEAAVTDVVEYLGSPSHFYAVSEKEYYLDYFISKKDKRSGITVYIDPKDDCITALEVSYY